MPIDLTQQTGKLVFEKMLSLRDQCAHWFAMTGNLQRNLSNNNLSERCVKPDKHFSVQQKIANL